MKPKVVVDAISLLSPLTGIGRYTYEISSYLRETQELDLDFYYGYYSKKLFEPTTPLAIKGFKSFIVKNPFFKKIARTLLMNSSKIFASSYELYWQPNFIPYKGIKAKKVITTVHDFSMILYKEYHSKERVEYFEKFFEQNIYKSNMIITGSYYTKEEILDRLKFEEKNIKVIYHGINPDIFKPLPSLTSPFNLPKRFILSVGSIEPRKNLIGLLQAYNRLNKNIKEEYHLVLVGFKGWNNKEILALIEKNKKYIHYLGYISDTELAILYNKASLFIYPSFYEGFGLPPLEAMACGTPTIISNVSSLPEVGGDAVLYCNPYDIEDIKNKIEMVLNDEKLQKSMREKGIQRAKNFTWEKSAKEHLKLFKEVLKL